MQFDFEGCLYTGTSDLIDSRVKMGNPEDSLPVCFFRKNRLALLVEKHTLPCQAFLLRTEKCQCQGYPFTIWNHSQHNSVPLGGELEVKPRRHFFRTIGRSGNKHFLDVKEWGNQVLLEKS